MLEKESMHGSACSSFTLVFPVDAEPGATGESELAKAIMARQFHPSLIGPEAWEGYIFSDMEIRIKESTDLYGAVLWPSVHQNLHISAQYFQPRSAGDLYVYLPPPNRQWCYVTS